MIHSVLVFSFVTTIAVIFTFLSNNPELSFITKPVYIRDSHLLILLLGLYIISNDDLDADARFTMLSLVAIILISIAINFFSGNQNFFIDSYALKNGMVLLLEQLCGVGVGLSSFR
jgi:hypothetical protein